MAIRVLSGAITEPAPNWSITPGEPEEGQQGVVITNVVRTPLDDWRVIVADPDTPQQEPFANNAATVSMKVFDSNTLVQSCTYIGKVISLGAVTRTIGGFINLNAVSNPVPQNISHLACRILVDEMTGGASLLSARGESTNPVLELGYGHEALMRFDQLAREIIATEGVRLVSARIREWVSTEDPNWQETVIDYEVEAETQVALSVWDELSDQLRNFQHTWPTQLTSEDRALLSVAVRWK